MTNGATGCAGRVAPGKEQQHGQRRERCAGGAQRSRSKAQPQLVAATVQIDHDQVLGTGPNQWSWLAVHLQLPARKGSCVQQQVHWPGCIHRQVQRRAIAPQLAHRGLPMLAAQYEHRSPVSPLAG